MDRLTPRNHRYDLLGEDRPRIMLSEGKIYHADYPAIDRL